MAGKNGATTAPGERPVTKEETKYRLPSHFTTNRYRLSSALGIAKYPELSRGEQKKMA
jgi:hypothetical protein